MFDYVSLDGAQQMTLDINTSLYKTNPETKLSVKEQLSAELAKTVSEIPFYVPRLEKHMEYISDNKGEPKTTTSKVKIGYSGKGKDDDENAKIISYDDGLNKLKSKKILVDSNLTDEMGRKIMAKALGIREGQITLVSWNDILDAIDKQEPKVAVVYLHDMGRQNKEATMPWSTDGTLLVSWEFAVSKDIFSSKRWGFQFPKAATYGISRNEIQILN